ncbi:Uncharacterised protein [Legionella busanensis]|uniref:Uncharacterized protein n=1 Tax=Legionella busanensis TaxID=190655 RepID=A0A378JIB3_9GAMM|nr:Uncharacterised protein [Legionella busanensis]
MRKILKALIWLEFHLVFLLSHECRAVEALSKCGWTKLNILAGANGP